MLGIVVEGFSLLSYIAYSKRNHGPPEFTVKVKESDDDTAFEHIGMTLGQKIMAIILVPIPMTVFALLVGFWGSRFLLVSESNLDMILNMVALMFVTEIGKGIWQSLVPSAFKKIRDTYP